MKIFILSFVVASFPTLAFSQNLIVIRHGEAEHNVKGIFSSKIQNAYKYPLTSKGKEQLSAAAVELRNKYGYNDQTISAVYYSPFLRTKESAEVLVEKVGISKSKLIEDVLLVDLDMGFWEEGVEADFFRSYSKGRRVGEICSALYKGESREDLEKRIRIFLERVKKTSSATTGDILVVTHGSPAVVFNSLMSRDHSTLQDPKNAEIKVLDLSLLH